MLPVHERTKGLHIQGMQYAFASVQFGIVYDQSVCILGQSAVISHDRNSFVIVDIVHKPLGKRLQVTHAYNVM